MHDLLISTCAHHNMCECGKSTAPCQMPWPKSTSQAGVQTSKKATLECMLLYMCMWRVDGCVDMDLVHVFNTLEQLYLQAATVPRDFAHTGLRIDIGYPNENTLAPH